MTRAAGLPAPGGPAAAVRGVHGHARRGPAATRRSRASTRSSSRSRRGSRSSGSSTWRCARCPPWSRASSSSSGSSACWRCTAADLDDVRRAGAAILEGLDAARRGPAAATGALHRRDRGRHRPARGDHQPQPAGLDADAGRDAAGVRDDARAVRDGRRQRGREGRPGRHPGRRVDDRRRGPRLHERQHRGRAARPGRDHAGAGARSRDGETSCHGPRASRPVRPSDDAVAERLEPVARRALERVRRGARRRADPAQRQRERHVRRRRPGHGVADRPADPPARLPRRAEIESELGLARRAARGDRGADAAGAARRTDGRRMLALPEDGHRDPRTSCTSSSFRAPSRTPTGERLADSFELLGVDHRADARPRVATGVGPRGSPGSRGTTTARSGSDAPVGPVAGRHGCRCDGARGARRLDAVLCNAAGALRLRTPPLRAGPRRPAAGEPARAR